MGLSGVRRNFTTRLRNAEKSPTKSTPGVLNKEQDVIADSRVGTSLIISLRASVFVSVPSLLQAYMHIRIRYTGAQRSAYLSVHRSCLRLADNKRRKRLARAQTSRRRCPSDRDQVPPAVRASKGAGKKKQPVRVDGR